MLKVFTDFHHASLLQSLIFLFENRLGGQVYRPIGVEWFEQGFWKVYDHPATVQQFLGIGSATPDNTPPLNDVVGTNDGIYLCKDIDSGTTNKAITLDAFMSMDIDIVIASIPAHIEPFKKLCELHPNKPKLIFQIGNAWTVEAGLAPNIMASAIINNVPQDINFISYHQEFDTKIFAPHKIVPDKNIFSFVNVFNRQDHFAADYQLFLEVERIMSDWTFKSYGGQCRDGAVGPSSVLADTMRSARFIWHTKAGGDGFGHVIHNAPAVGRPLIVKRSQYIRKMAEPLLIDGKTCIDIDGLTPHEIVNKILSFNSEEKYRALCEEAYRNFKEVVDFNKEAEEIKKFLSKLI